MTPSAADAGVDVAHIAAHRVNSNASVRELRPCGTGRDPTRTGPSEPWSQNVSSYAIEDGDRLLLFDPLAVPEELLERAAGRETAIVLTAPWHERDAQSLVERLGVPVYTPPPDTAQDLMDMYGITAEQTGEGSGRGRRHADSARNRRGTAGMSGVSSGS